MAEREGTATLEQNPDTGFCTWGNLPKGTSSETSVTFRGAGSPAVVCSAFSVCRAAVGSDPVAEVELLPGAGDPAKDILSTVQNVFAHAPVLFQEGRRFFRTKRTGLGAPKKKRP